MRTPDRPEEKMGTHHKSKHRKFVKAALRIWGGKKQPNQRPPRELRRSW